MQLHLYVRKKREWLLEKVKLAQRKLEDKGLTATQSDVIFDCVEEVLGRLEASESRTEGLPAALEAYKGARSANVSFAASDQWLLKALYELAAAKKVANSATSVSAEVVRLLKVGLVSGHPYAVQCREILGPSVQLKGEASVLDRSGES
jgi:repressor of nif and glnA expression